MKRSKVLIWFVPFVLLVPLLCLGILKMERSSSQGLPYYGDNFQELDRRDADNLTSFHFINQDGREITGSFTSGKVWVACYFFTTCPSICPKMIAGMAQVQEQFKRNNNLRMVSFTVDPLHDTPQVLREYAANRSIDTQQWNLITGTKLALYRYTSN